jgi:hypothetical protein
MKHLIIIIEDDDKSWKEDEQGLDPNTRCLLFQGCLVPSRVAPTTTTTTTTSPSDHGRID